ncbi:transcriptional regulator with XRE-family HTH domain [Kineosporia succinea]|uniref:Transcriptional regulator with XRE-family HTH domain n=1 Tax=Kineosporia succinea TaxID=84632 RepID=A0ABT9PCV5_9ACTN|nr:transcriptional regulator with XRE-family HTH domain [Kineosporia succinea]
MGDPQHARAEMRRSIGEFLTTRRARLQPGRLGLGAGPNRRVKGLRREEVAALAGISVEYYVRLERGRVHGASDAVLEGVSRALQFGDAEREHLSALLDAGSGTRPCRLITAPATLRPTLQRILDSMSTTPALVLNGRLRVVGGNAAGRALLPVDDLARHVFLGPPGFWRDWDDIAIDVVNRLRAESGRNPCDRVLGDLVQELSSRSPAFARNWARHDVHVRTHGVHHVRHPLAGDLDLPYEITPLASDPGLTLVMFSPEPGSASEEALHRLVSRGPDEGELLRGQLAGAEGRAGAQIGALERDRGRFGAVVDHGDDACAAGDLDTRGQVEARHARGLEQP